MENGGLQLVGEFMGFGEKQWNSGAKSGVDRFIVIRTGTYTDEFKVTQDQSQRVSLFDETLIQFYREQSEKLKGQRVVVPVVVNAREGSRGAWLSIYQPKGTAVRAVPVAAKSAA